jgi:hypothetical protein
MRWLGRLILVPLGLVLAIIASGFFLLVASLVDPVTATFAEGTLWFGLWSVVDAVVAVDDPVPVIDDTLSGIGRLTAAVLVAPPALIALVSEVIGARRLWWHVGAVGVLTGALPWLVRGAERIATPEEAHLTIVLALAGAVAGFVYWVVAGNTAGPPFASASGSSESSGRTR